jgi:hypothetical protein
VGRDQSAPEDLLLTQITQSGKPDPGAQRAHPCEDVADDVRASDRHDHDLLRLELPSPGHGGRLHGDLVAGALDQHHGHGVADLWKDPAGRLARGGRTTPAAIKRSACELTAVDSGGGHGPIVDDAQTGRPGNLPTTDLGALLGAGTFCPAPARPGTTTRWNRIRNRPAISCGDHHSFSHVVTRTANREDVPQNSSSSEVCS